MKIQLSDHFNYKKLIRFTLPSIASMIFVSIYGVVDGIFVSNFVGKTPFAAINLIYPAMMLVMAFAFMISSGGSALISKTMGEGKYGKANSIFSMLIYVSIAFGIVISVVGFIFIEEISLLMGADEAMLPHCVTYGRILLPSFVFLLLQCELQGFLIAAEKPNLALIMTVGAGCTNIILDAILVIPFGLKGAAVATAMSQVVGTLIPLFYFIFSKKAILRLGGFHFDKKALWLTCSNGASEMMTNLSMSLVNILYNYQLMQMIGEDGVTVYGIIMYINFIFIGVFVGFCSGSAPIISFHYGAENHSELKNLFKKSLILMSVTSVVLTLLAELSAGVLSGIFVSYDDALMALTKRAFMLYSVSFVIMWINIFGSAFFTALNNGLISAVISFLRTLVFQIAAIYLLPLVLGIDGIWLAIVAAELGCCVVTVIFLMTQRKKYNY
ncbi:MAG: MATE family efflux transporter [Clostridia bacterium]|nr:MATE family efflux transporter [Clostridia bacterium]